MESLNVGGKNYVKASVIARDLGYTQDYIGQLCRSGKVKAELVGRTWYVDRDSVRGHKATRYRRTTAKATESLRLQVANLEEGRNSFYKHVKNRGKNFKYESDHEPLIPEVDKEEGTRHFINVDLADSSKVRINSAKEDYTFETPGLPEVKFKGKVSLTDADDTSIPKRKDAIHIHPKSEKIDFKANNKVLSADQKMIKNAVSIKRVTSVKKEDNPKNVSVEDVQTKESLNMLVLASVSLFSLVSAFFIVGLTSRVEVVNNSYSSDYVFEISDLQAFALEALRR